MFALCFTFGGIVVLSAQDTQDTTSNQYRTEMRSQYPQDIGMGQPDRERIQSTELPDEVKRSLEGEEYRGWLISGAFRSQASAEQSMGADTTSTDFNQQGNANATVQEGEEFFTVELKNGAETKMVHFNSDGQILQGIDEGQNSPSNPYTPNPGDPLNQDPSEPNNQYNQDNQYNRNNQYDQTDPQNRNNQPDQMIPPDQTLPADPTLPDDPNAIDQPDQSQSEPVPGTPTPGTQPDQPQSYGPK